MYRSDQADIYGMLDSSQKIRNNDDKDNKIADIVDNITWKIIQKLEKGMCDFNDRYIEDGHRPLLSHLIILKSPLAARYIKEHPANQLNIVTEIHL